MKKLTEALHTAVQKGDISEVEKVISSAPNPSINKDEHAKQLFEKELCEKSNPRSGDRPIHLAARHGHVRIMRWLLNKGVDMESANLDGKRSLHEASAMGNVDCVNFLLEQGVLVDPLKRADW